LSDVVDIAIAIVVSVLPFYFGLGLTISALRGRQNEAVAMATGASIFLFIDPIRDTNGLGGFAPNFGPENLVILAAFSFTFLLLSTGLGGRNAWPLWVLATGIAIHTFAEASELAGSVPTYLSDFSVALPGGLSFVLHKAIEGFVLGAYSLLIGARWKQAALGGLPLVGISIAGAAASLVPSLDLSPFIAAGAGGWMFVVVALGTGTTRPIRPATFALILAGLVIVYTVGLLHST